MPSRNVPQNNAGNIVGEGLAPPVAERHIVNAVPYKQIWKFCVMNKCRVRRFPANRNAKQIEFFDFSKLPFGRLLLLSEQK